MTIKALVVDDSALMRKIVGDILRKDSFIEVIDTARDGKDAVEKVEKYKPDVITMDVEMPIMNGIEAVKEIMSTNPTPVVMISALTSNGAEATMQALDAGAVDFICKPSGSISTDLEKVGEEILDKVKMAVNAKVKTHKPITMPILEKSEIEVLIVDDSQLIRKQLKDIISREPDMTVISEATNGREAVEKVDEIRPDVIHHRSNILLIHDLLGV